MGMGTSGATSCRLTRGQTEGETGLGLVRANGLVGAVCAPLAFSSVCVCGGFLPVTPLHGPHVKRVGPSSGWVGDKGSVCWPETPRVHPARLPLHSRLLEPSPAFPDAGCWTVSALPRSPGSPSPQGPFPSGTPAAPP